MNAHDLKALKTRLDKAEADFKAASADLQVAQSTKDKAKSLRDKLAEQIKAFEANHKEPVVTEHALLRYFERVYKVDLEEIKNEILSDDVKAFINKFQSGKIPAKGCRLIVKDRVVVTIEAND